LSAILPTSTSFLLSWVLNTGRAVGDQPGDVIGDSAVEAMVGGLPRLSGMLGQDVSRYNVARQSANFYRHARTSRPADLILLEEARSQLMHVVRTIAAPVFGSDHGG
jgi:hypothetical protein